MGGGEVVVPLYCCTIIMLYTFACQPYHHIKRKAMIYKFTLTIIYMRESVRIGKICELRETDVRRNGYNTAPKETFPIVQP